MSQSIHQILHISRSGMLTNLLDLDVVSHNLSNINTTGYKSSRSNFQEMLNMGLKNGVQIRATQRFMSQGSLKQTSDPLDLAIQGSGFFAVTLPDDRTAYTRAGELKLDVNRQFVNPNGYPLVWDGQIPEDAEEVNIEQDGSVMVKQEGTWNQVGTIQLTRFPNANGLLGYGNDLWLETEISGAPQTGTANTEGMGSIINHALEISNVNLASEISQMVSLQRSFEMSLRTFQQTEQMLEQAIRMRIV